MQENVFYLGFGKGRENGGRATARCCGVFPVSPGFASLIFVVALYELPVITPDLADVAAVFAMHARIFFYSFKGRLISVERHALDAWSCPPVIV